MLEAALLRARWLAVPFCFALIPLYPAASAIRIGATGLLLILGNAVVAGIMHGGHTPARYRLATGVATALEWSVAVSFVVAGAVDPRSTTPAILFLIVLIDSLRFGIAGVSLAAVSASLGLILPLAAPPELGLRSADYDWLAVVRWESILLAASFVAYGVVRARQSEARFQMEERLAAHERELLALQDEEARWKPDRAVVLRVEAGLSRREWEILAHLAHEDMTYAQIAKKLTISPETVKSHTHRIGEKLRVTGRRLIVKTARDRGLIELPTSD